MALIDFIGYSVSITIVFYLFHHRVHGVYLYFVELCVLCGELKSSFTLDNRCRIDAGNLQDAEDDRQCCDTCHTK